MREHDRNPRLTSDLERLAHALEQAESFFAQVRRVDAAGIGGDLRQRDDFVGLRVEARDVAKPGAQSERALVHRLPDHLRHARELVRRRRAVRRAHDLSANRVVPGEDTRR